MVITCLSGDRCIPVVLAIRRKRQEDGEVGGQPGLHHGACLMGGGTCVRLQRGTLLNGRSLIPANCPFLAVGICERVVRNSHVRSMNTCHVVTDILYMCPQTQDAAVAR